LSPRPIEFPVEGLTDGVVRLRLIADGDIPAVVEAVQDPLIPRSTTVPAAYGAAEARQWQRVATSGVATGTDLATLVVGAADDRLLGAVGIHGLNPQTGRCSAGYWVAAVERRRGFATRALRVLCDFAFRELDVSRVELWIEPANRPSRRVAERVGFAREGLLRSFTVVGGERRDMLMYSLLPAEVHAPGPG
jgi:[ribosomal protein S5]-alanine N-acetyltransferase